MPPLPKRKHSTARKGKRRAAQKIKGPTLIKCSKCNKPKQRHRVCKYCQKQ